MKDIKNYVCTLEQAKKLKELGVEQDSLFLYTDNEGVSFVNFVPSHEDKKVLCNLFPNAQCYSAFTSQELMELIPLELNNEAIKKRLKLYSEIALTKNIYGEAQARAEFLINLLEIENE